MAIRIALYSHDSVGLGHVRRNLAVAHALSRTLPDLIGEPISGIVVTGQSSATHDAAPPGWDWLVVPGLSRTPDGYEPRHLDVSLDQLTTLRGSVVDAAISDFDPDLLIVDRHPFGVDRELERTLRRLRTRHPRCAVVLGLRDVLDTPEVVATEWEAAGGIEAIRDHFDALWVYGDPTVYDPVATGEVPPGLADLVVHTGYLAHGRPEAHGPAEDQPYILTTVGGGSDGRDVAMAAAAAPVPPGHRHLIVTGPHMPEEHRAEIEAAAGSATRVVTSVPNAQDHVRRAAAVVSMGGYNTVAEIMTTSTPALVIPRVARRREQHLRAMALAERGLVDVLGAAQIDDGSLGRWLAAAAGRRVTRDGIDLDGLSRLGALAAALVHPTAQEAADVV